MMNGGIDQQIQQKADAYRGNPQQLQQRYAQNKQLIDLLALQKLKSEKEAAARDMAMQMQQQPSTIKQQLESEMIQRTKDDMAKQLGGIMQKKQADQKKRASQMGIATNAAPNMQQMASGGIVGYAAGDLIDADDAAGNERRRYAELLKKARPQGKSFNIARLSEEEKAEFDRLNARFEDTPIQDFLERPISDIPGMIEQGASALLPDPKPRPASEIRTLGEGTASGTIEEMQSERTSAEDLAKISAPSPTPQVSDDIAAQQDADGGPPVPIGESEGVARLETRVAGQNDQADQQSGIGALLNKETPQVNVPAASSQFEVKPQTADYTEADRLSQGLEDAFRKDSQLDPTAAQDAEYEKALGRIGYSADEKALRQKRIDELEAIRQRRMSPEELRRQKMDAFLAAGSQQSGGIGSVFGAGFRGAKGAERQAQLAETGLLKDVMGAETDLMKEGSAQRTAAYDAGLKLGQQVRTQRGEGLKGIAGLSEGQARRAEEEAKRLSDANIATLEGRDRQRAMELKAVIATMDAQYKNDALKLEAMLGTSKNDVLKSYNEAKTVSDIQQVESSVLSEIAKTTAAYTEFFNEEIAKVRDFGSENAEEVIKALQQQQRDAIQKSTQGLKTLLTELRQRRTGFSAAQPTGQ